MTRSLLDQYLDHAGAGATIMMAPAAYPDLRNNTRASDWRRDGYRHFYRGFRVEEHDEWSWGWMVRKADGSYVEASGMSASGQDPEEGLEAKPASPTAESGDAHD